MTTMIRLNILNNEGRNAQLEKNELGFICVHPFRDRLERMNCVDQAGGK